MSEWLSGSLIWWARRRRFAEEWKFHLEMAVSELQSFGLGYREARRHARRRLGARAKHRRAAMREIGADARGLLTLLPVARARRSAMLAPCAIVLLSALALTLNPHRTQVLESMRGFLPLFRSMTVQRLLPLTPAGVAPTGLARFIMWTFVLFGLVRLAVLAATRRQWRAVAYGAGVLFGMAGVWGLLLDHRTPTPSPRPMGLRSGARCGAGGLHLRLPMSGLCGLALVVA